MATYLPTKSLTPLYTFIQYSSTVGAFETALKAAFPTAGVEVYADDAASGNALVVAAQTTAFTVPANYWVGFNQGVWQKCSAAQMAGGPSSDFTAYP